MYINTLMGDRRAVIPVIVGVLIIGTLGLSQQVFAADPDEEEDCPRCDFWRITSQSPIRAISYTGEAYILYSDQGKVLDKPIIVTDGIDPGDTKNAFDLSEEFNQLGLIDTLRDEGYDVIILNFHEGAGFIQGNAFVLIELIEKINANKQGDEPLVIVGPSMGGLVSRYALTYMETYDIPHDTWLWISFDTPHKGANVPLGNQYWLVYFSGTNDEVFDIVNDYLFSPAAKQMLLYHENLKPGKIGLVFTTYKGPDLYISNPGPDAFFHSFFNQLEIIGDYPQNLRKVAISNGNGYGKNQGFESGDQMLNLDSRSTKIDVTGNTWSLQEGNSYNKIFRGKLDWPDVGRNDYHVLDVFIKNAKSYDNSPGSKSDSSAQIAAGNNLLKNKVEYETFIPTISAFDFDTEDPFYNISETPQRFLKPWTPFDRVYYPTENQWHVEPTLENNKWILCEIFARDYDLFKDYDCPGGPQIIEIEPEFKTDEPTEFTPPKMSIPELPEWIQINAGWWANGTIPDFEFTSGIQYMIKEDIISIPDLPESGKPAQEVIPDWIKNNAGWWADGLISEDDFVNGIKFLIEKGIIKV